VVSDDYFAGRMPRRVCYPAGTVASPNLLPQAVVDAKPTEHARDLDRFGRVDAQYGLRWHTLPDPLVRSALVEVPLVLADERCEMEVVDQQHVVEQLSP